jgi:hypothetical protein
MKLSSCHPCKRESSQEATLAVEDLAVVEVAAGLVVVAVEVAADLVVVEAEVEVAAGLVAEEAVAIGLITGGIRTEAGFMEERSHSFGC